RDRGIEVNQRSFRSCSSSFFSLRKDVTGLRGGGVDAASAGGVIQPLRTASASNASASTGLLVVSGGTISATMRSRSVTKTVSPPAARRTYSLSLFLSTFRPTERMGTNVATGSHLRQCSVGNSGTRPSGAHAGDGVHYRQRGERMRRRPPLPFSEALMLSNLRWLLARTSKGSRGQRLC